MLSTQEVEDLVETIMRCYDTKNYHSEEAREKWRQFLLKDEEVKKDEKTMVREQ